MRFLDNDLPGADASLADEIQGNLVNGYRRVRLQLLFARLPATDEGENRRWFRGCLQRFPATSARRHCEHHGDGSPLINIMVSATGLVHLGRDGTLPQMDPAFGAGARAAIRRLNDPRLEDWDVDFREAWDVLVLVAHNGDRSTSQLRDRFSAGLPPGAEVGELLGNALDAKGQPLDNPANPQYEPFGFRDGISNPIFTDEALRRRPHSRMVRPLSVVLAPDPIAEGGFGSYFVFRKLHQDVSRFRQLVDQHVASAVRDAQRVASIQFGKHMSGNASAPDYREAAALSLEVDAGGQLKPAAEQRMRDFVLRRAVGRDRNGHPYTEWAMPLNQRATTPSAVNDFDYEADLGASVCPMQAHIRKVNPRGLTRRQDEPRRTIARRGMPYGKAGDADMGLLFLCAQADIGAQFEHIQRAWANNAEPDFAARPTPGYDNFIARPTSSADLLYETVELPSNFYDAVSLRGAEYFFAPSLQGLVALT